MKVKLKPPYELSEDEQLVVKNSGLSYHKIYEGTVNKYVSFELIKLPNGVFYKLKYFDIIEENMPTKEQVLEAASTSKEAKDALVKLFPKYFEDDKYVYIENEEKITKRFLYTRMEGKYKNKGFYLSSEFNWEIIKDNSGVLVLLPTKKEFK